MKKGTEKGDANLYERLHGQKRDARTRTYLSCSGTNKGTNKGTRAY
jgi:hypothetical protein